MPSVLIVEDHALFRSGLKQLIGIEPGLTVAGEAGDGLAGIRLAQSLRPDLILLDISMPELSGVEAIPRIREVAPGARILIVSMHATAGHVRAALKAGADGYLLKTADEDEFLVAIRALLKGTKPTYKKFLGYSPGVAVINDMIVGIENRDGNTNVRFNQRETLERIFIQTALRTPKYTGVPLRKAAEKIRAGYPNL